jgi:quinol monooxygenase YgiN
MVKVIVKMILKENQINDLKTLVPELVAETRKESGCIQYQLIQDRDNNNIFFFVEEWDSSSSLEKHMNSPHFHRAMPRLEKIQAVPMEINVCNLFI